MIDKVCNNDQCTGCSACANICPVGAIEMKTGKIGHIFPSILENCIECKRCVKVCPVNTPLKLQTPNKTFAFWLKDDEEHHSSTSGGAAACFTNYVLDNGGVV